MIREEKLKKDQAINKLAEMMMRKDLQVILYINIVAEEGPGHQQSGRDDDEERLAGNITYIDNC